MIKSFHPQSVLHLTIAQTSDSKYILLRHAHIFPKLILEAYEKQYELKKSNQSPPQTHIAPKPAWRLIMRYLPILVFSTLILSISITATASVPDVPTTIESFVSQLYPKGSHYFWVINQTTTDSPQEMIVDILTTLRKMPPESPVEESRFLLLIVQGRILGAQKIPLGSEVDCGNDEEV